MITATSRCSRSSTVAVAFTPDKCEAFIQKAAERALVKGISLNHVLDDVRAFRAKNATTPVVLRLSWALASISTVAAPVVTIVFFATLWHGGHLGMGNIRVHVLNMVFAVFDHVISARPVRLVHSLYVLVYGIIYLVFNGTLYATKGIIVYPILDWGRNPGGAVVTGFVLCFVGIPLIQLLYYGLYRLKCLICVTLFGAEV